MTIKNNILSFISNYGLLIIITVLSLFLRVSFIQEFPDGTHKDEAVLYNSYSLLITGKDEYSRTMPLIFEALSDFRLPVSIYTAVPAISLFGLNEFAVRIPTAIFALFTPLVLYFFTKKIFHSRLISLLSAFSLAVSPTHILFSRYMSEPTLALFTTIMGIYFLLLFFEKQRYAMLGISLIFILLSLFTYRTEQLFIPVLLVLIAVVKRHEIAGLRVKNRLVLGACFIIFLSFLSFLLFSSASGRLKNVGLQSSGEIKLILEEQIREDEFQNPYVTRIFHNKAINFAITGLRNYAAHFDLTYLFFIGDKDSSINSTPFMGHLLFVDLPFYLVGLYVLIKFLRKKSNTFMVALWLLVGPIASAFTIDSPSGVRNLISSSVYAQIIGLGLYGIIYHLKRIKFIFYVAVFCISLGYIFNMSYFFHQHFVHKTVHQPWYRDAGVRQMVEYVQNNEQKYDRVVFADYSALYIFLLFYEKVNPEMIQQRQESIVFSDRPKEIIPLINSKYSVMPKRCPTTGTPNTLYICTDNKVPGWSSILEVIRYKDTFPAFTLLTYNTEFNPSKLPSLPYRLEYIGAEGKN